MRTIGHVALLSLAGFLCGCVTVRSSTSPGVNLGRYHTFAFYRPANPGDKQLAFERSPAGQVVQDHIANDLRSRGLVMNAQNPDVLVAYHRMLAEKTDVTGWGYPGYFFGEYSVNQYTEGTLCIDLLDPQTHKVLWRGTASAIVQHPDNPDEQKLRAAVDKIMRHYPMVASAAMPTG